VIVGPGWPFLGLLALGLALFSLIPGCGLAVVENASSNRVRLDAPTLVDVDPAVKARKVAIATLAPGRARRTLRRDMLRVRTSGCAGVTTGSGFALDRQTVLATRDVLPGAGALKIAPRGGRTRALAAKQVFYLGELGVARVRGGKLPGRSASGRKVTPGASVAVVGAPLSPRPRLMPGVVVDSVPGRPFGIKGPVLRLSSQLPDHDAGGPVIDAKGRIVAVAFTTDPSTGFAVAVPVGTLTSLVAAHALEAAPACDGA
jgi:hypothetical protein